jgi:hypothetical protein
MSWHTLEHERLTRQLRLSNPVPARQLKTGMFTWWAYRRFTIDQFRRVADLCDRHGRRDLGARASRAYRARMRRINAVLDDAEQLF